MAAAEAVPGENPSASGSFGNEFPCLRRGGSGKEQEILDLIPKDNSWEQILYDVVAMNGLDPWNLDLNVLSKGFSDYITSAKEFDFRIPAKWVMISAVLLRMKSDHIKILKMDREPADEFMGLDELDALGSGSDDFSGGLGIRKEDIDPLQASPMRMPVRKVTITELVDSLRKVLSSGQKREDIMKERIGRVHISTDDITARIEGLYKRITGMLGRMDSEEIKFTELVGKWERENVIDHFMPLIHLDNDKKILCTQKEMFSEIIIKGRKAAR